MTAQHWLIGGGIAAAVGLGLYAYMPPAKAADKAGGDCCADLEERVAELEATVARKGNRKVTLYITGQVSKAILWTDGLGDDFPAEGKPRVIDNGNSGTRITMTGEANHSSSLPLSSMSCSAPTQTTSRARPTPSTLIRRVGVSWAISAR